jgi:hypothetical protein
MEREPIFEAEVFDKERLEFAKFLHLGEWHPNLSLPLHTQRASTNREHPVLAYRLG